MGSIVKIRLFFIAGSNIIFIFVLVLSYHFNVFEFIVKLFQKSPSALIYVDEIITGLLTLSIGFAVFSWRRWIELKKETEERIRAERELVHLADTKAETERIISKQLHSEIDVLLKYLKEEREMFLSKMRKEQSGR